MTHNELYQLFFVILTFALGPGKSYVQFICENPPAPPPPPPIGKTAEWVIKTTTYEPSEHNPRFTFN